MRLQKFFVAAAYGALVLGSIGLSQQVRAQDTAAVTAFLSNPGELLKQFTDPNFKSAQDPMTAQVKALALANPQSLVSLLSLLPNATTAQKQAIGKGLENAAEAIVASNPNYANDIRQAIVRTRDREVVLAATGDTPIGAAGGGGAGAGGGGAIGGQTNSTQTSLTSTGGAEGINGNSQLTSPFSVTSSVSGTSGVSSSFTSVSP